MKGYACTAWQWRVDVLGSENESREESRRVVESCGELG